MEKGEEGNKEMKEARGVREERGEKWMGEGGRGMISEITDEILVMKEKK